MERGNMSDKKSKPVIINILMGLVLFQGLSGLAGGIGLVLDPSGQSVQIPIEWLQGSPFDSYLIPGLVLLIVLGFYPLYLFYGLIKKSSWVWPGTLFLGMALLIWIFVEILVVGYHAEPPLQLIYGMLGLFISVLALTKTVKQFYKKSNQ